MRKIDLETTLTQSIGFVFVFIIPVIKVELDMMQGISTIVKKKPTACPN